jgi:hypothetical protein
MTLLLQILILVDSLDRNSTFILPQSREIFWWSSESPHVFFGAYLNRCTCDAFLWNILSFFAYAIFVRKWYACRVDDTLIESSGSSRSITLVRDHSAGYPNLRHIFCFSLLALHTDFSPSVFQRHFWTTPEKRCSFDQVWCTIAKLACSSETTVGRQ